MNYDESFKEQNEKNITLLRSLYGLPEITGAGESALSGMKGMLSDYCSEDSDSVQIIRSIRKVKCRCMK